ATLHYELRHLATPRESSHAGGEVEPPPAIPNPCPEGIVPGTSIHRRRGTYRPRRSPVNSPPAPRSGSPRTMSVPPAWTPSDRSAVPASTHFGGPWIPAALAARPLDDLDPDLDRLALDGQHVGHDPVPVPVELQRDPAPAHRHVQQVQETQSLR